MSDPIDPVSAPNDFPWLQKLGAVSGAASKLLLVRTPGGGFAAPTQSAEERNLRWEKCEVLAGKVARAATRSQAEKCSHMSEESILELYLPTMQEKYFASEGEALWIVRRAASILGWPLSKHLQLGSSNEA
jgi:hypothetical protein